MSSADYLAANFERYPLLLFAFSTDDVPSAGLALWNAMLAARAHGLGSCMTRMLCGSAATMEILGVPADQGWQMAGCATFGWPTGRWGLADRLPAEDVTFHNTWGATLPFRVDGPLYAVPATESRS
jgi:nitroreductase